MQYLLVISLRQFLAHLLTSPPSRDLAFSNALRLGICFTPLKAKFIRGGDLSGRVSHPWFTWFMTVMGVHLYQESRHQWGELHIQGYITQVLLTMVLKMQEDKEPPFTLLQAFYFMCMSCTYTHTVVPGRRYLERLQEMVKKERFSLLDPTWIDASSRGSRPTFDRPSEYTEEKHELVSLLLNLMYLQCIHCLVYDGCPDLFADLEAQLPDFEVRRLLRDHVPGNALFNEHLIASLSGGFRTLPDRGQSPHCSFGSGRVSTPRSAQETRFVHIPKQCRSYWCSSSSRSLAERVVDLFRESHVPTQGDHPSA